MSILTAEVNDNSSDMQDHILPTEVQLDNSSEFTFYLLISRIIYSSHLQDKNSFAVLLLNTCQQF